MDNNILKQLADIHNVLFGMQVQGDNAIKVTSCIITLRQVINELNSQMDEDESENKTELG